MKKVLFFCLCSFLSTQQLAQTFQKKQITNFNFDSRGVAFPVSPAGHTFLLNTPIFFEAHYDSLSNIMMMNYNPFSDSFYNLLPITNNSYRNINPIASIIDWYPITKINLVWQTNENGNWDIALKTLTDSGWTSTNLIVNSLKDEINPTNVVSNFLGINHGFDLEIIYESENSVFLYQKRDSIINHEIVFLGNDSLFYSQPTGLNFFNAPPMIPRGLYIASKCTMNDSTSKIVYRYKSYDDSLWSSVCNAYDSGYTEHPKFFFNHFYSPFLSFEKKVGGKKKIFIIPDLDQLGQNQSAVNLVDNDTIEISDLTSFQYPIIVRKEEFDIYGPFSYKIFQNDSVFVFAPQNYIYHQLFQTKILNTKIGLGNVGGTGPDGFYISYFIWEDSSNNHINLFGVKRYDIMGEVNDKIIANNFILYQNYPNPFNPKTIIQYNLLSREFVTLKVFDVLGNEVAVLVKEEKDAGEYKLEFEGSNLASGIYVYRLSVGSNHVSKKMILLK